MANVVLLEGDDAVADFVTDILRSAGHQVRSTGVLNGLLGQAGSRADLVICDTVLEPPPQEVVSTVRCLCPDTSLLLTTTFLDPFRERLLLELGADAVIRKPFDLSTFLNLVHVLSSRRVRRRVLQQRPRPR